MSIQIVDNGASLKIINNNIPRFIMKSQIIEVEVLKNTIIKIDIGLGVLYNVYVDQQLVTQPPSSDVNNLRDLIVAMLQPTQTSGITGYALETSQLQGNQQLVLIKDSVAAMQTQLNSVNDKLFYSVKIVDETNPNFKYEGYAQPGARISDPHWAISKVTNTDGIITYEWAMGNKNFDKVWDNRAGYQYS